MKSAVVQLPHRPRGAYPPLTVVHISDTHNRHVNYAIPPGDVLIHTGDVSNHGTVEEVLAYAKWLQGLPHPIKIQIGGNHERQLSNMTQAQLEQIFFGDAVPILRPQRPDDDLFGRRGGIVLHNCGVKIAGITFYGVPQGMCGPAFYVKDRAPYFEAIPRGTDVLVTHNPAWLIADLAWVRNLQNPEKCQHCGVSHENYQHWGEICLNQAIPRCGIRCALVGHVHDEAGFFKDEHGCLHSNAAMDLAHKAHVIRFECTGEPQPQQQPAAAAPVVVKNNNVAGTVFEQVPEAPNGMVASLSESFDEVGGGLASSAPAQAAAVEPFSATELFLRTLAGAAATTAAAPKYAMLLSGARGLALDRDWYSTDGSYVHLWRPLPRPQSNQVWQLEMIRDIPSPFGNESDALLGGARRGIECRIACLLPVWKGKPHESEYSYGAGYLAADMQRGSVLVVPRSSSNNAHEALRWAVFATPNSLNERNRSVTVTLVSMASLAGNNRHPLVLSEVVEAARDENMSETSELRLVPVEQLLQQAQGRGAKWTVRQTELR